MKVQDMTTLFHNEPDSYIPEIDRSRCHGCGLCVYNCPNGVFELRTLSAEEKSRLPFFAQLRVSSHGNRQAFVVKANSCKGYGLCIENCRKRAIKIK